MEQLRYTAIPLVTVDPYFSVWSFADHLYDDDTRHWSGKRNAMTGVIEVDGKQYQFMGNPQKGSRRYSRPTEILPQRSVEVSATRSRYIFENDILTLQLDFRTPILVDDLELSSRPVSYVSYNVSFKDGKVHSVKLYFDVLCEICTEKMQDTITIEKSDIGISCGLEKQEPLKEGDDLVMIDWGRFYLYAPGGEHMAVNEDVKFCYFSFGDPMSELTGKVKAYDKAPALCVTREYESSDISDFICLAYDDIYAVEYFGEKLPAYWKRNGMTIEEAIQAAVSEYDEINAKCDRFDRELRERAERFGSKYADILCLTYRQIMAAHKLCEKDGKLLYFSKECSSGGFIATVDVTYPTAPIHMLLNPDFLEGMLNPVFEYAEGEHGWMFDFAPHDLGMYPISNGQQYGVIGLREGHTFETMQMPVEECGNMLICTASLCKVRNDYSYATEHREILTKWADYLVKIGYDPDYQLCTDDFAGHLAHNCNLSVKGILGIALWGETLEKLGCDGSRYIDAARKYAAEWKEHAFAGDHYGLTFDSEDTWSLKYNLVWDKIWGLGIFDDDIFKTEIEYYKTKMNRYGIPLDSRSDYTKSDWQMWSTCLVDDEEYRNMVIDSMWRAICDLDWRGGFSDWYFTSTPEIKPFWNRSVQGGLFLPLVWAEHCTEAAK